MLPSTRTGRLRHLNVVQRCFSILGKWSEKLTKFCAKYDGSSGLGLDTAAAAESVKNQPTSVHENLNSLHSRSQNTRSQQGEPQNSQPQIIPPTAETRSLERTGEVTDNSPSPPPVVTPSIVDDSILSSTGDLSVLNEADESRPLPKKVGERDRRYIIRREQLQFESSSDSKEALIATVSPEELQNDSSSTSRERDNTMAAMDEDIKNDGTFRRVHIRYEGDPAGSRAPTQHIMHDTGAGCSLTFESKLKELGLGFEPVEDYPDLKSVTGATFRPIGIKQISFSYHGRQNRIHWANVFVLKDPENGTEPAFDILLGRDTISKVRAINWDRNVIGHIRATLSPVPFPSLFKSSPRASACASYSEETSYIPQTEKLN